MSAEKIINVEQAHSTSISPEMNEEKFSGIVDINHLLARVRKEERKEYKTNKMSLGKINIRSQSSRANESATNANYRGAGLSEMAYCIENKKIHKCNGDLSLHVLDIIDSMMRASVTGISQKIKTKCKKPNRFTEQEIKKILKK